MYTHEHPVAILGAGPVGLAAASHLAARTIPFMLFERATEVAASVRDWAHVPLFSPWRYNIDRTARAALEASGAWRAPPDDVLPTGGELYRQYLAPLAALPVMRDALRLDHEVIAVARKDFDKVRAHQREASPFVVRCRRTDGRVVQALASAVIDTTGVWTRHNPLGANGLPAIGEHELAARIRYGIPDVLGRDRDAYAGRRVAVVGAGHSAANSLLALMALARTQPSMRIHWLLRGANTRRVFGGGDADALPARGRLGAELRALVDAGQLAMLTDFRIQRLEAHADAVRIHGDRPDGSAPSITVDRVIGATGLRPDLRMLEELRIDVDQALESVKALAPLIDPNEHSCGTVRPHGVRELAHPEPGFFIAGNKSYGRAPTFLLATGYEQVRSIAAALDGDLAAAHALELDLPQTGVCSSDFEPASAAASACCAPVSEPAPRASACCAPASAPVSEPAPQASACCAPPAAPTRERDTLTS